MKQAEARAVDRSGSRRVYSDGSWSAPRLTGNRRRSSRRQHPVEETTIAGNLKNMFRGRAAVGNDVDRNGNIRTGSILIESMTLAGS
jgi:hypothetical protein